MIHIIKYTLLENLRSRIYLSAVGLVFLILGLCWIGSSINYNFGDFYLTVLAFGMNLTELLVIAIVLFLPVAHLSAEFERGTAQVLWAKLDRRSIYYLGKYYAFLILVSSLIVFAGIFIGILAFFQGATLSHVAFMGYFILGQFFQAACVLSLVFLLYALLRSPAVASLLGLLLIYFSIFVDTARDVSVEGANGLIRFFYAMTYLGMPKLGYFNFEDHIIYQKVISFPYFVYVSLYALIFAGSLLCLSNLINEKREI